MSQEPDHAEVQQRDHDLRMLREQNRAATQMAAEEARHRVKNPEFLKQLQEADVDTDLWDWVEDEFGPTLSGSHILGHRSEHFEEQQDLLNRNKVERMVAERSPGRLLRENPRLLALWQGIRGTKKNPDPTTNPEYRGPLTPRKKRVVRDAGEVVTTRQTLSIGGRGVDAASAATVENRTVTNEEQESSGIASKAKGVFR